MTLVTQALTLLFATTAMLAASAAPFQLSVSAPWEGGVIRDRFSEVRVTVVADVGGRVTVRVDDQHLPTTVDLDLLPRVPASFTAPVLPDPDRPVSVTLARAPRTSESIDESTTETLANYYFHPLKRRTRLIAIEAGVQASMQTLAPKQRQAIEAISLLRFDPADLPETSSGYDALDTLMLSTNAYLQMNLRQRRALSAFVEGCGRLGLLLTRTRTPHSPMPQIDCGPDYFTSVALTGDESADRAATSSLLEFVTAPTRRTRSSTRNLHALLAAEQTHWIAIAGFLSLYVIALLVVVHTSRSGVQTALVPVVATIIGWAVWHNDSSQTQTATWAEMHTGSKVARYQQLVAVTSTGSGDVWTRLSAATTVRRTDNEPVIVERTLSDERYVDLSVRGGLLSHQAFVLAGSLQPRTRMNLEASSDSVLVTNTGATPSPAGVLGWGGDRFEVPPLDPGGSWTTNTNAGNELTTWTSHPAEALLRSRAYDAGGALLLPLLLEMEPEVGPELAPDNETPGTDWLLVTGE